MKRRRLLWVIFMLVVLAAIGGLYFSGTVKKENISIPVTPTVAIAPSETSQNPGLANPAAVYCIDQGGKSEIVNNPDGSQGGKCVFSDGRTCDEWDFFRTKICR